MRYSYFNISNALATEAHHDGTLLVRGEDWLLRPINIDRTQLPYRRPGTISRGTAELRHIAAQAIQIPTVLESLTEDIDYELRELLKTEKHFISVPEAQKVITSDTVPVAELETLTGKDVEGNFGMVVSGLGSLGLLAAGTSRQLFVASRYDHRPPDSEYIPYIP